jgi:hypothetical protein
MTRRIEVTDGIAEPWREATPDTRIRFHFTGRFKELGLIDNYIEVAFSRDGDAVTVRSGHELLTIGNLGGNSVDIAPQMMFGGAAELLRLRKREIELVEAVNEAQNAFGKHSARAKR